MNSSISLERANQTILWRFRRDDSRTLLIKQLEEAVKVLGNRPFAFLIDLCFIRYILQEDKQIILQIITMLQEQPMLELSYFVDYRNYDRMRLLIKFNQLPNSEMVFKYKADALEYLSGIVFKYDNQNYVKFN